MCGYASIIIWDLIRFPKDTHFRDYEISIFWVYIQIIAIVNSSVSGIFTQLVANQRSWWQTSRVGGTLYLCQSPPARNYFGLP